MDAAAMRSTELPCLRTPIPVGSWRSDPFLATHLNETPNPNPLMGLSLVVDQIPPWEDTLPTYGVGTIPRGGSSEGFVAHENASNYWPGAHNTSLPRVLGPGYGWSSWLPPCPQLDVQKPYYSEASNHVINGTTPENSIHLVNGTTTSVHMINGITPYKISEASCHVENGAEHSNISETSTRDRSAVLDVSSQQSDTVLGSISGLKFSSKLRHENAGTPNNKFHFENDQLLPIQRSRHEGIPYCQSDMKSEEISYGILEPSPHKEIHSRSQKEEKVEVCNDRKGDMEAKDNQRAQSERVVRSKCTVGVSSKVKVDRNAIDSSVFVAEDAPLSVILEGLQYLSDILLSSDFDATELKDYDRELLLMVIDNLGAFTIKNKKDVTDQSFHDSGPEEKMHSFALNTSHDELDFSENHNSSYLTNDKNVAQAIEKTVQTSFCNNEESFQAQLYKKLWIDAEASLCLLKYELQLAQMKSDTKNHNHHTKGKLQQTSEFSSLNSTSDHDEHEIPLRDKEKNPPSTFTEVASVKARLKVLKDRDDKRNSTSTEQQPKLESLSDLVLTDDTCCYIKNGPEINTSTRKSDEKIRQGIDVLASSTDRELGSCLTQSTSAGEGGSLSSEWEQVLVFEP